MICGIDEAGRGPVIGPLVMAGAVCTPEQEARLKAIGVKDSKMLLPAARKRLFDEVKGIVTDFEILVVSPKEIDDALASENMNLNSLEALDSAKITSALFLRKRFDTVVLDCPSNNTKSYAETFKVFLKENVNPKIVAEHKADANYVSVSAASILAKVTRDRMIEELKEKHKVDFGSGYPSDPKTISFLKDNWNRYDFFRKSWQTYKTAAGIKEDKMAKNAKIKKGNPVPKSQKGLGEF